MSRLPTLYFFVAVDGVDVRTTVWAHQLNPRPFNPGAGFITSLSDRPPSAVDALIEVVWPHDRNGNLLLENQASLANIGVDLAQHSAEDTTIHTSVGFEFDQPVLLLRALNNGFLEPVKTADAVVPISHYTGLTTTISAPRWVFNDVDVSAAIDPANKYYFAVQVQALETHTTIWVYGSDPRTSFPEESVPFQSCRDTGS